MVAGLSQSVFRNIGEPLISPYRWRSLWTVMPPCQVKLLERILEGLCPLHCDVTKSALYQLVPLKVSGHGRPLWAIWPNQTLVSRFFAVSKMMAV